MLGAARLAWGMVERGKEDKEEKGDKRDGEVWGVGIGNN
jgi:hypothetical protein